jgi:hypothetical protein
MGEERRETKEGRRETRDGRWEARDSGGEQWEGSRERGDGRRRPRDGEARRNSVPGETLSQIDVEWWYVWQFCIYYVIRRSPGSSHLRGAAGCCNRHGACRIA